MRFTKAIFVFFSFGLTFAGSSSIQGALFNQLDQLDINGLFYILGTIVYEAMLFITIKLAYSLKSSLYLRSFIKASILSLSHISPVYLCTLAVIIDVSILLITYKHLSENITHPKLWFVNGIICNVALLLLFFNG